ncbi:MFS transporter [Desulfovibrio inopinatus]|uniref:MFS transporter n=1 Tax=Desulfovibrio inopinatus TaxID=102109 RepID=UPI0004136F3D|nr:MFS transporter [Desulfovibrio inopinatus]
MEGRHHENLNKDELSLELKNEPVVTPAFLTLCAMVFLALCNNTVFYNFHLYLVDIGFTGKQAGLLVGMYSLAAMTMYALFSQRITRKNAAICMSSGMIMVMGCGFLYLIATSFSSLLAVRIANGIGGFLLMASATVLLVAIIPPQRTGQAFSLYSVFLLLPYAAMPPLSGAIVHLLPSPVWLYPVSTLGLLPALLCVPYLRKKAQRNQEAGSDAKRTEHPVSFRQAVHGGVLVLLTVNFVYFLSFSGMFFLFKGLAVKRAYTDAGLFFTVEMMVMIGIRLVVGRLFDRISSVVLVSGAFVITAVAFWVLQSQPEQRWLLVTAALFGLGMGFAVPPLNSMMYRISAPEHRGFNVNMMMLTVHLGTFFGPFLGAWAIETLGYDSFLHIASVVMVSTAVFYLLLNPRRYLQ